MVMPVDYDISMYGLNADNYGKQMHECASNILRDFAEEVDGE